MRLANLFADAWRGVFAALISGAAAVVGYSPDAVPWVTLVSLIALFCLWYRAGTPRRAALLGFAYGLGLFGAGASWVYVSLHDFGMMPAPLAAAATAFFCVYLSLYPALAGSLQARLDILGWPRLVLLMPGVWVLCEWMRGWVLTGFPWLATGYAFLDTPFVGYAPLAGVYGTSLTCLVTAGLLAGTMVAQTKRARMAMLLVALAIMATGALLRTVEWTQRDGEPVSVALLQGNVAQSMKFEPAQYAATLASYKRMIEASRARLIVLPETAIPRLLDQVDPAYLEGLATIARSNKSDILVGAPFRNNSGHYYNGVVNIGFSELQFYAKSHLVPLGEFVPPEFKWILAYLRIPLSDFSAGIRQKPMRVAGERVGLTVCYEDAFGEELINQLPEASLLANLSNVAWFGDSLAPGQHLQMSRLRAIETGRYMLRATNTGVTALIDDRGVVLDRLPSFTEGVLQGEAVPRSGTTPYILVGNRAALALALALIAVALILALRQRAQ